MTASPIIERFPLGQQWPMFDPFLFCAHHNDAYPAGDDNLGPSEPLSGRQIGSDFSNRDGWSMYHGTHVPGFPQHPHRGFETISYVTKGVMDHADSLGATARFGDGDIQWMTAGAGVQHSEMFPLVNTEGDNPLELFQIWLNLPAADKMVDPYFTMLWRHTIPVLTSQEGVEVTVVAGELESLIGAKPPVNSWASRPESDIAIWHIRLDPHARWSLPATRFDETNRALYAYQGAGLTVGGDQLEANTGARIHGRPVELINGEQPSQLMLIQGRPIGEPVVQYGPFVMNTPEEIQQTMIDYQRTQFGGWPWPNHEPNHGGQKGRFAIHPDGRLEEPAA